MLRVTVTLVVLLAVCALALAGSPVDDDETGIDQTIADPEPWKEGSHTIPPFPEEGALVEFDTTGPDRGFRYYIDAKSLTVGADGVVRYTVVIESRESQNVLFEGIRCGEREIKTYAFGTPTGTFKEARRPQWKRIRAGGTFSYRSDLERFLLCDPYGLPFRVDDALRRLRQSDEHIGG